MEWAGTETDEMAWMAQPIDSFVGAGLRETLALQLKARGSIRTPAIEAAVRRVPRHLFVPHASLREAYADKVIQTKSDRGQTLSTLSQPTAIVTMLEQLRLAPGLRVLEIGAGSGYNAALLAELARDDSLVTTVDIDTEMARRARLALGRAGHPGVTVETGDGFSHPIEESVDRMELSVEAPFISPHWVTALKPDGILLLPMRIKGVQYITPALRKQGDALVSLSVSGCAFMPLRGEATALNPKYRLPGLAEAVFGWEGPDEFPAGALGRAFKGKRSRRDAGELPLTGLAFTILMDDCSFSITNSAADGNSRTTMGIYDPDTGSACLLMPGSSPGAVGLECYRGDGARRRLQLGLEAWDSHGRPGPEHLHIRAFPKGKAPKAADGWRFVEKPFFDLLIAYDGA